MQEQEQEQAIHFKLTEKQYARIRRNAKRHTNGNISEWLRYSGTKFKPVEKKKKLN